MGLFGYPYNNDKVICKDSCDYLQFLKEISLFSKIIKMVQREKIEDAPVFANCHFISMTDQ